MQTKHNKIYLYIIIIFSYPYNNMLARPSGDVILVYIFCICTSIVTIVYRRSIIANIIEIIMSIIYTYLVVNINLLNLLRYKNIYLFSFDSLHYTLLFT